MYWWSEVNVRHLAWMIKPHVEVWKHSPAPSSPFDLCYEMLPTGSKTMEQEHSNGKYDRDLQVMKRCQSRMRNTRWLPYSVLIRIICAQGHRLREWSAYSIARGLCDRPKCFGSLWIPRFYRPECVVHPNRPSVSTFIRRDRTPWEIFAPAMGINFYACGTYHDYQLAMNRYLYVSAHPWSSICWDIRRSRLTIARSIAGGFLRGTHRPSSC